MTTSRLRALLLLLLAASYVSNSFAAETAFDKGINNFRQQQYQAAVEAFNATLRSGDTRAIVYYNLAVSEYRLNRLEDAAKHFTLASSDKDYYDLSVYNLGLIDTRLERYDAAKRWFNKVSATSAVKNNARRMITRINSETAAAASFASELSGLIRLTAGNDDNVNRVADNTPLNLSDNTLNLFASINSPLGDDFKLDATVFITNYDDINSNDFAITRARISHNSRLLDWNTRLQFSLASSKLAHSAFQQSYRIAASAKRKVGDSGRIRIIYEYDDITSKNVLYDQLQGWRQRIRVGYRHKQGELSLQGRYRFEFNDRLDTATQSYSPDRHTLRAILKYRLESDWQLKADLSQRNSDYPSVAGNAGRSEDRFRAGVFLSFYPDRTWTLEAGLRHTSNTSDNISYEYDRNEFTASAYYQF